MTLTHRLRQVTSIVSVLHNNTYCCLYKERNIDYYKNKQRPIVVNRCCPTVSYKYNTKQYHETSAAIGLFKKSSYC